MKLTPTLLLFTPITSSLIGSGLLDTREIFFNEIYASKYNQVFDHGCHCSRIMSERENFKGQVTLASSPETVDSVDLVCKKWIMKRRCLNSPGGACYEQKASYDLDQLSDCSGIENECARASCLVDQASLGQLDFEISTEFQFAITGDPVCFTGKLDHADKEHAAKFEGNMNFGLDNSFKTMTQKVCYGEAPNVSFQDPENLVKTVHPHSTPQKTEPAFCLDKVDLVFAIDGSGSLSMLDFQIQKDFIFSIIEGLKISSEKTRVAVIQYNKDIRTEFNFISDELELINNVFALRQWGVRCRSCSRVGLAYDYIIKNMYPMKRPDAQMRIIALSDGYTKSADDDKRLPAMRFFQTNNIPVYYIAVQDCDHICNVCKLSNCPNGEFLSANHVSSGPGFHFSTKTKGWQGLRQIQVEDVKKTVCEFKQDEFSPSIEDDNPLVSKSFYAENNEFDDAYDDYYNY